MEEEEIKLKKNPKIVTTADMDVKFAEDLRITLAKEKMKRNPLTDKLLEKFFENPYKIEKEEKPESVEMVGFHLNPVLWGKLAIYVATEVSGGNRIGKKEVLTSLLKTWVAEQK